MNTKYAKMLKVTGILMIIGGAFVLLLALMSIGTVGLLDYTFEAEGGLPLYLPLIVLTAQGAVELAAGIFGVKAAKAPEKAKTCVVLGILVLIFCVTNQIATMVNESKLDILNLALGVALPVIYLVGAIQIRKAE